MMGANTTDKDRNQKFWEVHFVKILVDLPVKKSCQK